MWTEAPLFESSSVLYITPTYTSSMHDRLYIPVIILHLSISFNFDSLKGHLVPYKHQRRVPTILEIIHVATLVRLLQQNLL